MKNSSFAFLSSPQGLGATYDDHLRLIGKRVVDFLLVIVLNFFSLSVTAEALRANIGSKSAIFAPTGTDWPKISGRWGRPHQPFFQKTRLNDLSYGITILTYFSSVLSQFTRLTDGQTDGRTDRIFIARPRLHSMQRGKETAATAAAATSLCNGSDT